ncbi:UDP-2,4-diacetamido-2,4,6-trideoxy-beta-L-altropyranose hydrolase [Kurthia sibirica]|uniref:UDP-2,4-diacetamido-2,4, 6-trideoxy-beta-L-altropyranose hydrolase n=1 Tax=Kurthia sibirica TaxID=202750 RepID=A0A2U3AMQ5_9BACL|nr:UDP-2,4-diacetamido-2,4,6-trideoxy-beta-L-altropyranose hydrolase [Kurthia sibirica]PWI25802.1 UDP-2,4-diacetamido-2,4,6-trideoxy-beta-L-altropyranose hydrolase [Kurthia sibirica]GEK33620.1 UDP-2,4-diacetamido-2,4,6-trideoxy-beta-L-altropyranose hydrolase [Kurthia sibirica]
MNILFRVDSAADIGSGHVMRCLTLAEQLIHEHNHVEFLCRDLNNNIANLIINRGFEVHILKQIQGSTIEWTQENWFLDSAECIEFIASKRIDLLIVDHYGLDYKWEEQLSRVVKRIMVIDDLANRNHQCDLLLDQNYYKDYQQRYSNLLADKTIQCVGPSYALLREEFFEQYSQPNSTVLFIFFGSADATNETQKTLEACIQLQKIIDFSIEVVIGQQNKNSELIKTICMNMKNCHLHIQANNMAEIISRCTLSIGACGTTTWERAILRVPSIVIAVAENQIELAKNLQYVNAISFLGEYSKVSRQDIYQQLLAVFTDSKIAEVWSSNMESIIKREHMIDYPLLKKIDEVVKFC